VLEACPDAVIARVAWVYGIGGRGFGCTAPLRLARGETVDAISDRVGHPTYVQDIVTRVLELLSTDATGIFHVVNQGSISWYTFSRRLALRLERSEDQVRAVSRQTLPPAAPRPSRLLLESSPLPALELGPLRPWTEAQDAFMAELRMAGLT